MKPSTNSNNLLNLPPELTGSFVSGATMSNFVGLALARQWFGKHYGVNVAQEGLQKLPHALKILSATPHSSIYKALAMLGIGRDNLERIPTLPDREAIDLKALEKKLAELKIPAIVVANAGTVNTVDYDDLEGLKQLKERYPFWLHVDAAFGAFAACSPKYAHYLQGIEAADSICIDAHKYLNVPYDAAMQFTKHLNLQGEVFANSAVYLAQQLSETSFIHLTPENSRRLRALPAWFSLQAYGKQGYQQLVEQSCALASEMARQLEASGKFQLLAPMRLNGLCFGFRDDEGPFETSFARIQRYLKALQAEGSVFLSPTSYKGKAAIRASVSNWRTQSSDINRAVQAMLALADE
ncbi:MAG: pyridoxal-dependent decarboxylase [Deinococcales bacterium]